MNRSNQLLAFVVFGVAIFHWCASIQAAEVEPSLTPQEEQQLDHFLLNMDRQIKSALPAGALPAADDISNPIPGNPGGFPGDVQFPTDPTDQQPWDPNGDMFPFPTTVKSGTSDKIALEVLFQTFNFYGVAHIVEKKGSQVDFKIIKSKYGYFSDTTKLDVAYALREFSRYLGAHLCGQPTMENFSRAFAQVPVEEIGLRFKYDMAWAILGNSLPREPNEIMKLGTRWKALDQIIQTTTVFRQSTDTTEPAQGQYKELRNWTTSIRDVVNILTRLNKLLCYVDIRPNPKEELKKRIVVGKILEMSRQLNERYAEYKDILDEAAKQGKADQLASLRK